MIDPKDLDKLQDTAQHMNVVFDSLERHMTQLSYLFISLGVMTLLIGIAAIFLAWKTPKS